MKKKKNNYNLIIFLFSILLGFFISGLVDGKSPVAPISIKTIQDNKMELIRIEQEIDNIKELVDEKESQYDKLKRSSDRGIDKLLLDELDNIKLVSGFSSVKGPGIKIVMRDSNMEENSEAELDVIHDADVLRILNDLRSAGAEAISLNKQRVLSFSEIKCGGPIIRVNGRSMGTPFVIEAIGDPKLLKASVSAPNTYAYALKNIDKISISLDVLDEVIIEGYSGSFNFKNTSVIKEGE